MWFSRYIIKKAGNLPEEVTFKITSYFEWNQKEFYRYGTTKENWPMLPDDDDLKKISTDCHMRENFGNKVKNFFVRPHSTRPFKVPRFTLTTYQPNAILSRFEFEENNYTTDDYLLLPFRRTENLHGDSEEEQNLVNMEMDNNAWGGDNINPIVLSSDYDSEIEDDHTVTRGMYESESFSDDTDMSD